MTPERLPSPAGAKGIGIACQTYSWQMSLDTYRGRLDHITRVVDAVGFPAVEAEVLMLGERWDAGSVRGQLAGRGLTLAALCLVEDWRQATETGAEQANADRAIDAVASMPGAVLNLCQMPGADRADLSERQAAALRCVDAIAKRAADRGVHCTFHPNSPPGSVFRTADDYDVLLGGLPAGVGFTPDLGHIVKGGMDPLEVLRTYWERVDHLHVKDIDGRGEWARTGEGVIDFPAVGRFLADAGYRGWIVMEDESPHAERDPDGAAAHNAEYARTHLLPVLT